MEEWSEGVGERLGDTEVLSPPWSLYEIFLTFLHILTVPSSYNIIILKRIDKKLEKILYLHLKSPVCLLCVKQLKWSIFRLSADRSKLLGADEPNETPAQQKATTSLTARYTIYTTKTNNFNSWKLNSVVITKAYRLDEKLIKINLVQTQAFTIVNFPTSNLAGVAYKLLCHSCGYATMLKLTCEKFDYVLY